MLKNLEGHSACILTRALGADFSQSFDVQDRAPEAETTEGTKMQSPLLSLTDHVRFITTGVSVLEAVSPSSVHSLALLGLARSLPPLSPMQSSLLPPQCPPSSSVSEFLRAPNLSCSA